MRSHWKKLIILLVFVSAAAARYPSSPPRKASAGAVSDGGQVTTELSNSFTARTLAEFLHGAHRRQRWRSMGSRRQRSAAVLSPADVFRQQSVTVSCSALNTDKQSCLFKNVCLIPTLQPDSSRPPFLTVVLLAPEDHSNSAHAATEHTLSLLKEQLNRALGRQKGYQGTVFVTRPHDVPFDIFHHQSGDHHHSDELIEGSTDDRGTSNITAMAYGTPEVGADLHNTTDSRIHIDEGVTVLWGSHPDNQESFGHAMVNEAFPLFLVLNNHFDSTTLSIPRNLQLLVAVDKWDKHVLPQVLRNMISRNTHLLGERMAMLHRQGKAGICFRHLLLGDGGYISATRASLANSGKPEAQSYSTGPSFFSSRNWQAFRNYGLQVAGVMDEGMALRPLILLNDKRYHSVNHDSLERDRRMIVDIDQLAAQIKAAYPAADVVPVRFRDLSWADQLRMISRATVFITTQGSSAFRLVYLPQGATCIVIGSPKAPVNSEWQSYHELDRWFPLSYIRFQIYEVDNKDTGEYVLPDWSTDDKGWWYYNADVRVRLKRLRPMLNWALGV